MKTAEVYEPFWKYFQTSLINVESKGDRGKARLQAAKEGTTSRFLFGSLLGRHKVRLLAAFCLQVVYSGVQFVGPIMLNNITKFLTQYEYSSLTNSTVPPPSQADLTSAYLFAMGMFLAPVFGTLCATMANRLSIGVQIMIRAELTAAIYRKALRLSTKAKQDAETGRIVNLMSADVNQLQMFFYPFATQLLTGPAMLITALALLWFQIQWATFIGLGILLLSTPATSIFVKKLSQYRREMLKYTDQRVKLMNQLLVGIRVLKMYAWEAAQESVVLEVRKDELGRLRKAIPMRVGMQTLLFAAPNLAMVVCFAVYGTVNPSSFTPAAIFTSISLFALMRFPLIFLPFALVQLTNALVSMRRLTSFFLMEDRKEIVEPRDDIGLEIIDGNFYWPDQEKAHEPEPKAKSKKRDNKKKNGTEDAKRSARKGEVVPSPFDQPLKKEGDALVELPSMMEDETSSDDIVDSALSTPSDLKKIKDGEAIKNDGQKWWLRDVNIKVNDGELVCVVGRVGCGKSSLIHALLGGMECDSGRVLVGGKVAYAAQQAWIVNATVKENVLFGQKFDEEKWSKAIDACCLTSDLAILPAGEETEIGEKGINLSGGQKQRVSLARALYSESDVYILDDPLSAVDVHVGRHIFDHFINGAIKGKARLLVTNQVQYCHAADRIIVLEDSKIVAQGTYNECLNNEVFARLLSEHNASSSVNTEDEVHPIESSIPEPNLARADTKAVRNRTEADALALAPGALGRNAVQETTLERGGTFARLDSVAAQGKPGTKGQGLNGDDLTYGKKLRRFETMAKQLDESNGKKKMVGGMKRSKSQEDIVSKKGSLIVKEDKEVGQVTGRIYWKYISAYGVISFLFLIALWSSEQAVRILTNWWLSQWTNAEVESQAAQRAGLSSDDFSRTYYIGIYLAFAFGYVLLTSTRATANLLSALRASRIIHLRALAAIIRAPVAFFDTTPIGRILNRFSKDTDDVDFLLSMSMSEFGNCIMQLLATLIFIAIIQPWILVGIAPLGIIYYFLQKYYRRSNIELQRLDAVSRSPIYAHFSESLAGVDTIRAYRLENDFALSSDKRVDDNHRAYFCVRMANEWLSGRLDIIGACVVFLTAILSIVRRDVITASLAALTLSEALDVTLFLKAAVTSGAMFENRFNSVERLVAYWELPQEAPAKLKDHTPPDDWPHDGRIEFKDVEMKYRPELDPVLKGVSFIVEPGDKVGIVGRTGSGKSSLIVALFRIVEPYAGSITLDSINLLTIGLEDVRSRIAAIPQDPVLFSGSVRTNLDPYNRHTDAELWESLGHVALKEVVSGLSEGLSSRVAEGGDNFSVGQRQLLCVARALLRRPRVLVADEATASVDSETDSLIQKTIRKQFKHCTVLTIAHRLNTVLDSTRVLVMEDGYVKEYDTVPKLMGRSTSTFRSMVMEAGLESPSVSRASSAADLKSLDTKPSFVSKMKTYGLK